MNEPNRHIPEDLPPADSLRLHGEDSSPRAAEARSGPTISRRAFAATAGSAALWPWVGFLPGRPARAVDRVAAAPPGVRASHEVEPGNDSSEQRHAVEAQEREDPPGTQGLLDYLRSRYGDRLGEEDLERIREGIAGSLRAAEAILRVPLTNGDEPAFLFRAYRRAGS